MKTVTTALALALALPVLVLAQDVPARPEWAAELDRKLAGTKITLHAQDLPTGDIVGLMGTLLGQDIALDPAVLETVPELRFSARDVSAASLLHGLSRIHDLRWGYAEGAVVLATSRTIGKYDLVQPVLPETPAPDLDARKAGPIEFSEILFGEALAFFAEMYDLDILVAPELAETTLTLRLEGPTARQFLALACPMAGARFSVEQGLVIVQELPPVAEKARLVRLTLAGGAVVEGLLTGHEAGEYRLEVDGVSRRYAEDRVRQVEFLDDRR